MFFPFFFARWRTKRSLLHLAVQGHGFDRAPKFMNASSTAVTPAGSSQFPWMFRGTLRHWMATMWFEDALWHWTYSFKFLLRNLFKRTSLYSGWVRKQNLWPNHSFRGMLCLFNLTYCCDKQCYLAVISCFPGGWISRKQSYRSQEDFRFTGEQLLSMAMDKRW